MRAWELLCLAVGGIRRTPLRMALTVLGVGIATGLWVSLVGFCLGVQKRIEEPFQRLELFNRFTVAPKHTADAADQADQTSAPPVLDDAAITRILSLPGVTVAYPELRLNDVEVLEGKQVKHKTYALSLPRASGQLRYAQEAVVAGRFFTPAPGTHEVILGRQLAKKLGFDPPGDAVGRTLTLRIKGLSLTGGRTFEFSQREIEIPVVGVWDPARTAQFFSTDILILPLDVIRELPGALSDSALDLREGDSPDSVPGYRHVVVRVERPADLFEAEERIQAMGFATQNRLSNLKELRELFILMDLVWGSVGAVALLVAGLGIINTMLMAVLERYREIGVYKALGASDGDIRLLFLAEAGLVGLLGGVLGLALGRLVSWLCEVGFNAFAQRRGIEEPMASAFPPHLLLSALAVAVIVSLISGVYPASRAARVDPIRALRSE